ncbi:MAG: hypothetical protein E6J03_12575 [Chloroflexi bacterium]|nr:MAG: hypothetical protein E6J03_12575 [Chloroflexota bacterium]
MERIADRAGVAAGWLLVLGVVVHLAPEAGREAKELASQLVESVRARLRKGPASTEDLEREVQDMRPAAASW